MPLTVSFWGAGTRPSCLAQGFAQKKIKNKNNLIGWFFLGQKKIHHNNIFGGLKIWLLNKKLYLDSIQLLKKSSSNYEV